MPSSAGGNVTYIPTASTKLIVGYSRDRNKYAVNKLTKMIPTDKQAGYYWSIRPQESARILSRDGLRWADGAANKVSDFNKDEWNLTSYQTDRIARTVGIGYMAVQQAEIPVKEAQSQNLAMNIMQVVTKDFYTLLASNTYLPGNAGTASSFGGGVWANATTTNRFIQKTLQGIGRAVEIATVGAVKYSDLTLVISPAIANVIASTQEFGEGVIQSQGAVGQLQGTENWNSNYGIGPTLYGMNVVVDQTVQVTTNQNAAGTATGSYMSSSQFAYVIARPGDLVDIAGVGTDFSTVANFVFKGEEMLVEEWDEQFNKRWVLRVTYNNVMKVVANETAGRIDITA
jgi:hypothetical protein